MNKLKFELVISIRIRYIHLILTDDNIYWDSLGCWNMISFWLYKPWFVMIEQVRVWTCDSIHMRHTHFPTRSFVSAVFISIFSMFLRFETLIKMEDPRKQISSFHLLIVLILEHCWRSLQVKWHKKHIGKGLKGFGSMSILLIHFSIFYFLI